jgi:hypothetical protein
VCVCVCVCVCVIVFVCVCVCVCVCFHVHLCYTCGQLHGNFDCAQQHTAHQRCTCVRAQTRVRYGRGWVAVYTSPTGKRRRVFVKTLGIGYSDIYEPTNEKAARAEAAVFLHPWFPAASDQTGAATARMLHVDPLLLCVRNSAVAENTTSHISLPRY